MQSFSQVVPIPGKGLRKLEISAYIKSENVKGNIALWCQVKDENKKSIDFGNSDTQNHKVTLNSDWKKYSLEFIVDNDAKNFVLGGFLSGSGNVWFDDFTITEIPFSSNPASKTALKYIDEFKEIVKKKSIFRNAIDWKILQTNLTKISGDMETIEDTGPALSYIMKTLATAGDHHSFIQSKENTQEKNSSNPTAREPESQLLDQKIGYIMVPGFSSLNKEIGVAFAEKIQNMIRKLDAKNDIKGWIIDLRQNSGGNMHPMIGGLGPLTGEGILGYFVVDGKTKSPWKYQQGKITNITVPQPYTLKKPNQKIAILIGPATASSGEATAISFIGKKNAKTFGQPSAGYTSANQDFKLSDGKSLYLASSYEMDRTGKEYKEKIQPDVLITPSTDKNTDADIQKASDWILE
ncbi:hypothetical protein CJF12_05330 [Chryseobacterium piperi]|uniref:S41 family peptidase n=1 Tax=Chryseobacterium piperi TaxID=558152 RepID=UPI000690B647|nr:S41 family peptidase [Chryseobacterium piperi]ASW73766.1 hypothetical protein CJF12_05330 [Chryseobacterium piperi]